MSDIAASLSVTASEVALAWLLARRPYVVPIPGTKRRKYLEQNVRAAALKLDDRHIAELEAAFPHGAASGRRYPEAMMASLGR